MYKSLKHTLRPYAKHCSSPVEGFPFFDPEAIKYCSLSRKRKIRLSKKSLRSSDIKGRQTLKILIENFDQVAYMFGLFSGIRMSPSLAKDMLRKYGIDGCQYVGASPLNVPWNFAYMADFQSLYGRIIHDVSLQNIIMEKCSDAYFEKNQLKSRKFLYIGFWFTGHIQKHNADGSLYEAFDMIISVGEKDIVRKTIVFDHELFRRLLHVSDEKRPNKEAYVSLAREAFAKFNLRGVLDDPTQSKTF